MYGKAETVRLSRAVVGVLAEDDNLYFVKRAEVEGAEDILWRWIDFIFCRRVPVFLMNKFRKLLEICFMKFCRQDIFPGWLDLD